MEVFSDELFAPLICLSRFSTTEELLGLLHGLRQNHCLWIWTGDALKSKRIADVLSVDYVWMGSDLIPICEPDVSDLTKPCTDSSRLNPADYFRLKLIYRDVTSRFADPWKPSNYN
jgi:hypothetical protein